MERGRGGIGDLPAIIISLCVRLFLGIIKVFGRVGEGICIFGDITQQIKDVCVWGGGGK